MCVLCMHFNVKLNISIRLTLVNISDVVMDLTEMIYSKLVYKIYNYSILILNVENV